MLRPTRPALLALALIVPASADDVKFKKIDVNPTSVFEAAGAFDVDNDGAIDIVSGDTWYKGPDFKQTYKVRDVSRTGTYRNCFSAIPLDVNGDGKTDFITCSYFEKNVGWVENPGEAGKPWTYHEIDLPGNSEAAVAVDLTGDGKPEILPNTVNTVVFYGLESASSKPEWKAFRFGNAAAGHGIGTGDVNGDGRTDLLTPKGWFEAPANPASETWPWHPEWNLGATGIQILARDIDGDGLSDLVYGMGHARGLYWIRQEKGSDGSRKWGEKQVIDPKLTSVHTLLWTDLDGDGKKDELLTGKRVYAHEREEGDTEASVIAYYTFDRDSKEWTRHVIFEGEPAANAPANPAERDAQKDFPAGTAGTGLEIAAVDIDGDGDTDLVCPGKSGLYVFENQTKSK